MPRAPSTPKFLRSADGTTLFAEATGSHSNPHVVLLPGLGLSTAVYNDFCADERLLNSVYVRVDPRGHGQSGPASTAEAHESKRYAEDFEAVLKAFDLRTPVLVAWHPALRHRRAPPFTLSGAVFLAAMPWGQELLPEIGLSAVLEALGGLLSPDAKQSRAGIRAFIDLIFREPATVPYGRRLMYYGHDVDPAMLQVITVREQDREKLRIAGEEGLPLMIENGTNDGHQKLWITLEYLKKWFRDLEVHVIEGGSHALHDDHPDETIEWILGFVKRVYGKDYRAAQHHRAPRFDLTVVH